MNLGKCCVCLDEAIAAKAPVDLAAVVDAITLAPFIMGSPQGALAVPLPMCLKHRQAQLGREGARPLLIANGLPGDVRR